MFQINQLYEQILLLQQSNHLLLPVLLLLDCTGALLKHLPSPLSLLLLLPPTPLSLFLLLTPIPFPLLLLPHQLSQGAWHDLRVHLLHLGQLDQDPNMFMLVGPPLWKLWILWCCCSRLGPSKKKAYQHSTQSMQKKSICSIPAKL